ncbi:hypothetical protein IV203_028629 [Nitzschia inconspicua]|uniref:Uncharacterized protein n=1 Tax=Nitzschia inconspicua TaxID=303405 RepID=A0A9K3LNY7_9STRA|nr:hypothetical protein IV203_004722 [Nitzschia inconspicua]KAG7365959.1 hypothetical protein IV203_028629 [Nitzschia inconspicua]
MSTNSSYQYSTIGRGHGDEENIHDTLSQEERTVNNKRSSTFLILAGVVVLSALFVATSMHTSSSRSAGDSIPLLGMAKVRSCTFKECFGNSCNQEAAPFICLRHNGGPHMGCSPIPWTPETCDDDCDLSGCSSLEIPSDTESCKGVSCGKEWCAGGQVCPGAASYQCQDGSARFGCSTDPLHWTLRTDDQACSKCCDTKSC